MNKTYFDFSEVEKNLKKLALPERRKAAANGCRNAARLMAKQAAAQAPVGTGVGSSYDYGKYRGRQAGRLKASVYTKSTQRDKKTGNPSATFGFRDPVAHLIEYGHRTRLKNGSGKAFISPKPFMRPAIEANKQEAFKRMGDAVERFLDKHFRSV